MLIASRGSSSNVARYAQYLPGQVAAMCLTKLRGRDLDSPVAPRKVTLTR